MRYTGEADDHPVRSRWLHPGERAGAGLAGLSLAVFAAVFLWNSLTLPPSAATNGPGPGALPAAMSILLLVFVGFYGWQTFRPRRLADVERHRIESETAEADRGAADETDAADTTHDKGGRVAHSVAAYVLVTLVYVVAVPIIGFFIGTGAAMMGAMLLRRVPLRQAAVVTVGFLAFCYLVFSRALVVLLPAGPWGF